MIGAHCIFISVNKLHVTLFDVHSWSSCIHYQNPKKHLNKIIFF